MDAGVLNIMVLVLIIAGIIALFLGDYEDAVVIFALVIINTLIGFNQEYRAERAIAAEAVVPGSPELIPVALVPVTGRVTAIRHLERGCRFDPLGRQQLSAIPLSFLQIELAELCDVFGLQTQTIATDGGPLRAFQPEGFVDAERIEKTRLQIVLSGLAGS